MSDNIELGRYLLERESATSRGEKIYPVPAHLKKAYDEHWAKIEREQTARRKERADAYKNDALPQDPLSTLGEKMSVQTSGQRTSHPTRCLGVNKDGSPCKNVVVRSYRCQWH